MKLIDVLVKQSNGEIRKGTKLIIDFRFGEETYTYDGYCFVDESNYQWSVNHGASIEIMKSETKLIEPPLYYLKMPNSDNVVGVHNDLIVFTLLRNIKHYNSTVFLFSQDEIDSIDILAPYRNFEWSEYNESVDS